ncbi:MAG: helix-turn-helix domain-containing protein [Saprospiraceae bacterium]
MKLNQFLILLFVVSQSGTLRGQLSAGALQAAVDQMACADIASDLDKTPLVSERMKFQGAICYFRNGQPERALHLFREVRRLEAERQHMATFWEAKCLAALGRDSAAVACLLAVPAGVLHHSMLKQPVFDNLAKNDPAFRRLKKSLEPRFNLWTGALAAIAVSGLLVGFLLLFGQSRFSAGERRLAVVVFSFAITLASYVLIWTGYASRFPYLNNLWQFLTLLIGPSLFFYLKDTFKDDYSAREAALHYAVPTVSGLATVPMLLSNFGINLHVPPDLFAIGTSPVLLTGHLLYYTLRIWGMTQNEWQADSNISVWTRVVARGMALYTLAFLSYFVLVRCSFFNPEWDYAISFVMALGILAVAYMGLLQRRVFRSEPIDNFLPVKKYRTSGLTEGASASIKRKMELLLAEQQVFKENELRLDDLAAYLNINRHQLSQVINEHYGVNFFELINRYRIEHVKHLLADPAYGRLTIIQIAYEAGFNNKASFNRYFKKATGDTPSAYRIRKEVTE